MIRRLINIDTFLTDDKRDDDNVSVDDDISSVTSGNKLVHTSNSNHKNAKDDSLKWRKEVISYPT